MRFSLIIAAVSLAAPAFASSAFAFGPVDPAAETPALSSPQAEENAVAASVTQSAKRSARVGGAYESLVAKHAAAHGVPASLVHRVIMRESRYNPRAVNRGNYGMMQIRLGTARALGYNGGAAGLLDADTNMTYAVKYLAGAYRTAGGNADRAVGLYARGYYYEAKRQGRRNVALAQATSPVAAAAETEAAPAAHAVMEANAEAAQDNVVIAADAQDAKFGAH